MPQFLGKTIVMQKPRLRPRWMSATADFSLVGLILGAVALPYFMGGDAKAAVPSIPVEVIVSSAGAIQVDGKPVMRAALADHLRDVRADSPERNVVVKTDRSVRFSRVKSVLRECQETGFAQVSLVASETPQ